MPNTTAFAFLILAVTMPLAAQSHIVVPSANATIDAMSYEWVAGASNLQRQQTLVGVSHLTPLLGRQIDAIAFRRTAVNEAYLAGAADMTVVLSTVSHAPELCSNRFASNVGQNALQVFSGRVEIPASPAVAGSTVLWTPSNTVRIALTQPFLYQGGTLCIDITGQPVAGKKTWWMADAIEQVIPGTAVVELGGGCGGYGGPNRQWSHVAERSLVPGGFAIFRAEGTPNGLAFAMFGSEATAPQFPQYPALSQWGIQTPNCVSYLNPFAILATVPSVFDPQMDSSTSYSAIAEVLIRLPASSAWFGFQLTTQWFDLQQLATSNGLSWTVGSALPALDMALCEGNPQLQKGNVTTYLAHVMRFEYQ